MAIENDQMREVMGTGFSARHTQSISPSPAPGMTTIEIYPREKDIAAEIQRALEVLRQIGVRARPRMRPLEITGLIQVPDADADRAIELLRSTLMRAAIRPS